MKRRTFVAVLLAVVLGCACLAYAAPPESTDTPAASEAPGLDRKISLTLFMLNEEEKPYPNLTILVQKDLESEEAYEGRTNDKGELVIPVFPLTSFILATRDEENTVTGLAQISLYPGDKTRIINQPQTDDTVTEDDIEDTAFARNVAGSPRANLAISAVPVSQYEVQVANDAEGIGCLLQLAAGNELRLRGVANAAPAELPPEPTLPPDASDVPGPSESTEPTASVMPTETAQPTTEPTAEPTGTPTPAPTETPAMTESPTPAPTAEPTPSPTPTPAPATPAPTAPSPSQAPTTLPTYVNMKLFLKSPSGEALSYYVATLNNVATAAANENGESYFMNVATDQTNTLTVRNPQGVQVGTCGIRFIEGNSTTLASVNSGGTYTINYAPGQQDVYVEVVVDTSGTDQSQITLSDASGTPLTPGSVATPTPTEAPTPAPTENTGNGDVIGTPAPTPATITGPAFAGYFSNEAGVAIPGATIRILNTDTKNLSSSVTNSEGAFGVSHMPPGNYYLTATSSDGQALGSVQFAAARGNRTRLKTAKDGQLYLSEGDGDGTVYVDLRELSNGQVGMLYASKSPLAAPAVLTIPSEVPGLSSRVPTSDELVNVEESELVLSEPTRPPAGDTDPSTLILVLSIVGAGAAVAAILLVRRAHIR